GSPSVPQTCCSSSARWRPGRNRAAGNVTTVIAILGAGKMGEALISGLLRAGRSPSDVLAVVRRAERGKELRESYGIGVAGAGEVLRIPESQQDAATALSGSGPAYVYFLVEAMVDAGILLGIPRATAREMVIQAVYGAATMLRETGEHPVILREAVTSPGGTT